MSVSVPPNSDEYNQIQHYLSMCSDSCGIVSDLTVTRIDNPELTSSFERKTGGLLRVPSWVNAEDLPEDNSLEEIGLYGFQLQNTKGMSFSTGIVDMFPTTTMKQFVYCEVAVGRARVCDPEEISAVTAIPAGFDSLYVPQERVDRDNDGEVTMEEYDAAANFDFRNPSEYCHQYIIKDGLHVNPRYIVEFMLLPLPENEDDASEVSAESISIGKSMNKGDNEDTPDFFDPVMYRSVSLKEKMSNANLSRRLIPIEKAFHLAQDEAQKEDSILNQKIEWIDSKLSEVDVSVRKVNMNYAEQYEEIVSASEKAISQLQQLSKSKLELLLGIEMELRREKEEIAWMECFIAERSSRSLETCGKNRDEYLKFLNDWKSHAILRNGLSRANPQEINMLGTIKPDMVVHPVITVTTEEKLPAALLSLTDKTQSAKLAHKNVKDDDNESVNTSRISVNECLHDAKHFFDALATSSGLYSNQPAKPLENLISPDTQALVDRNVTKIEAALAAALEESATSKRGIPLPESITRSTVSGNQYALPDDSHFKDAYNVMGNNENYTDDQLQGEMEKNILHFSRNGLHSSEANDESIVQPHRSSLADLRPLGEHEMLKHDRPKHDRAETIRASVTNTAQQIFRSNSQQSTGFLTATEDFDGDLNSYLESTTEPYRPTYSLVEGSKRRHSQMSIANANFQLNEESAFHESEILKPDQAESLYLNLPFFSKPPNCNLMYSTLRDGSGLELMYEALHEAKGPNVLVIQSGDFIFGAYTNQTLNPTDEKWTGSPSCFLFSITFDLKIPYHGRSLPGKGQIDHPCAFYADENNLMFGNGDLVLDALLETGSSQLENCFGLGIPKSAHAATTLLAGVSDFAIDSLELWQISSVA